MSIIFSRSIKMLALILLASLLSSCGIYSFTGASIPPAAKTISILTFPNNAPLVQQTLSQDFTNALIDKFSSQTNLSIVSRGGDLHLEGEITDYSTQPVAIQSSEQAALNRLTISVRVRFINEIEPDKSYETSFSRFKDYSSSLSLTAIEESLIREINEALIEDIFNKAVVNW